MAEGKAQRFFTGKAEHTIDNQNRVTIPSIWRGAKGEEQQFFIAPHPDKGLWVFPEQEMERLRVKLAERSLADRDTWKFVRVFSGEMHQCVVDSQGRITLSEELLKHAGLSKGSTAVLVGMVKHIEIWTTERWEQLKSDAGDNYGEITARVGL
jgi:MraZ protein